MKEYEFQSSKAEEYKALIEERKKNVIHLSNPDLEEAFGGTGLRKGSIYLVAAGTGVGKTSFLIATAKQLIEQGKKVAYISVEMAAEDLLEYLLGYDIFVYEWESDKDNWKEFEDVMQKRNFDIVLYDYIGAEGNIGEWDKLVDFTTGLTHLAITYNIPVLTACQATAEIRKTNLNDPLLTTTNFISFSKNIANKIASGIYIVPSTISNQFFLINFKNRYGIRPDCEIKVYLDRAEKKWLPNERKERKLF